MKVRIPIIIGPSLIFMLGLSVVALFEGYDFETLDENLGDNRAIGRSFEG